MASVSNISTIWTGANGRGQQLTFRFEITIDEAHQMQVFQRRDDLGGVKPCVVLREALARARLQRSEELTAHAVLHAEVQIVLRLEGVVERDDERMICRRKNLLLRQGSLNLLPLYHLLLRQDYPPGQDVSMPIGDTATHLSLRRASRSSFPGQGKPSRRLLGPTF